MKDSLTIIAILAAWIVLNRWILPRFGVQTCMSGACARAPHINTPSNEAARNPTDARFQAGDDAFTNRSPENTAGRAPAPK